MLDASTSAGARAAARLRTEHVIWLTTVSPAGQPQTSPVWFLYANGEFLIYSLANTARTRNLATNRLVSLHLDGDGRGGNVLTIEGEAQVDPEAPPANEMAAYQDKYAAWMARNGWTPESFAGDYPVAVRVRPTRVRSW
jgi:PPOX class probable F420-dependent enzyme